jgi:hypothetical protein
MKWIDIRKQQPDPLNTVFIFKMEEPDVDTLVITNTWGRIASFQADKPENNIFYGTCRCDTEYRNITHWMPLPLWPNIETKRFGKGWKNGK